MDFYGLVFDATFPAAVVSWAGLCIAAGIITGALGRVIASVLG